MRKVENYPGLSLPPPPPPAVSLSPAGETREADNSPAQGLPGSPRAPRPRPGLALGPGAEPPATTREGPALRASRTPEAGLGAGPGRGRFLIVAWAPPLRRLKAYKAGCAARGQCWLSRSPVSNDSLRALSLRR